jgi:Tfp pilus assembly protein PilV
MFSKAKSSSKNAFTLIEVLLAAVIMLAGIVGMMQAITSGSEMLDVARKQTIATQIMHGEIEKIRVSDWSQVSNLPTGPTVVSLNSSFQSIAQTFQCTREISAVRTDLKQVSYRVTWVGNTGRSYSRSSSTYVGKNGLYVAYQR